MIVLDAVAFQPSLQVPHSIKYFWQSIISEWVKASLSQDFVVLVRESQHERFPDDTVVALIPDYFYGDSESDHVGLQSACDQVNAKIFISTFYTYPLSTPSLTVVYSIDNINERPSSLAAQEKHNSILNASAFACPSKWVASDLMSNYPGISEKQVSIIFPGLHHDLKPPSPLKIRKFKEERNLERPYIIFRSGEGESRKAALNSLIEGLGELASGSVPEIVILSVEGSGVDVPLDSLLDFSKPVRSRIHELKLALDELPALYTGALALFETEPELGIGNYLLEVLRCGCPVVILGKNMSYSEAEVARPWMEISLDPYVIAQTLDQLRDQKYRNTLSMRGIEYTKDMTWEKAAGQMWSFINSVLKT